MTKRHSHSITRQHGFTLIELLVVIAIISLLVSILLPSLQAGRDLARQVACLSNLRQCSMAHNFYAEEHNETYVYGLKNGGVDGMYWYGEGLYSYIPLPEVGNSNNVLICPGDDNPKQRDTEGVLDVPGETRRYRAEWSYFASILMIPFKPQYPHSYVRLSQVKEPAITVLQGDSTGWYCYNEGAVDFTHHMNTKACFGFADGRADVFQGPFDPGYYWKIPLPDLRWEPYDGYWTQKSQP